MLFNPDNEKELLSGLNRLADNPTLREILGVRASELVLKDMISPAPPSAIVKSVSNWLEKSEWTWFFLLWTQGILFSSASCLSGDESFRARHASAPLQRFVSGLNYCTSQIEGFP